MLRVWEGHKHRAVRKLFCCFCCAFRSQTRLIYETPPPPGVLTPSTHLRVRQTPSRLPHPYPRNRSPIIDNHLHPLHHTPSHPPAALQRPHNQALHRVQHRPRNHLPSRKMLPRRRLRSRGRPHRKAHPHSRRTQPSTSTKAYPTITKQTPTTTCGGSPFKTTQSYHIEPISYEFNMI